MSKSIFVVLAAALAVSGVPLTVSPAGAQEGCRPFADAPYSPARHEIAGRAGQTGNSCPRVNYEILIKIDASFRPDPTVATVTGSGGNFNNTARDTCGPPTGQDTDGFYTELRINGDNVAQSPRVQLDGCRA
ncbi:MAG: hypothetical protein ACRDY7_10240 [Acidimicrobiia bacterium]